MVALKIWGHQWRGRRFRVRCDNSVAVSAMNLSRIRNHTMQAVMREIVFLAAMQEFEVLTSHIEGQKNEIADALSRWHIAPCHSQLFYKLTAHLSVSQSPVPEGVFSFSGEWV